MLDLRECFQLCEAAKDGRADDVIALLAEGFTVECKNEARSFVFVSMLSSCVREQVVQPACSVFSF
jgi:hypothetical protein